MQCYAPGALCVMSLFLCWRFLRGLAADIVYWVVPCSNDLGQHDHIGLNPLGAHFSFSFPLMLYVLTSAYMHTYEMLFRSDAAIRKMCIWDFRYWSAWFWFGMVLVPGRGP